MPVKTKKKREREVLLQFSSTGGNIILRMDMLKYILSSHDTFTNGYVNIYCHSVSWFTYFHNDWRSDVGTTRTYIDILYI
jgi:hypothetical protein